MLTLLLLHTHSAPALSDQPQRVVPAGEILERIERGLAVNYSDVIVEGDLDLSELSLHTENVERSVYDIKFFELPETVKAVESPIRIADSVIRGEVDFQDAVFKRSIDLDGTEFQGDVHFEYSQFRKYAYFSAARFKGDAYFWDAQFNADAYFTNVAFNGYASFFRTRFNQPAYFSNARFSQDAYFGYARFEKNAYFGSSRFSGCSDFREASFAANSYFTSSRFSQSAYFWNAIFKGPTFFWKACFDGYADFGGAQFTEAVDFGQGKFRGPAEFKQVLMEKEASFDKAAFEQDLNLENSKIYSIRFNAILGNNTTLNLKDSDINRMLVSWEAIDEHLVYHGSSYLMLIRNFRGLEQYADADDCYYRYKREKQARQSDLLSKSFDVVAWLSCGYGVRPMYTLFWSLFSIIFFGLAYWTGNAVRMNVAASGEDDISLEDAIYFSALIFVTHPPSIDRPVGRWRYLVLIEDVVGCLLLALFLVTLGNVMIR
ncbi:MAG: hypothetical protein GKC10_02770 [Methanosarcinales archaeon]|nr:hypothetical protein [Methanosarcinales archaeon]